MKQTILTKKGFTIVEMLIAVFIFTVAISALTFMAGRGIRSARESQNRIVAEYLAIEGIEVVRNVRDSAFVTGLTGSNWEAVFGNQIVGPGGCFTSFVNPFFSTDEESSCSFEYSSATGQPVLGTCSTCRLFLEPSTQTYTYESGISTPFTRRIFLEEITSNELRVRVIVSWADESIEYQENLFIWG